MYLIIMLTQQLTFVTGCEVPNAAKHDTTALVDSVHREPVRKGNRTRSV